MNLKCKLLIVCLFLPIFSVHRLHWKFADNKNQFGNDDLITKCHTDPKNVTYLRYMSGHALQPTTIFLSFYCWYHLLFQMVVEKQYRNIYHHWITNFELQNLLQPQPSTARDEFRKCNNKRLKLKLRSAVLRQGSLHCCPEYRHPKSSWLLVLAFQQPTTWSEQFQVSNI